MRKTFYRIISAVTATAAFFSLTGCTSKVAPVQTTSPKYLIETKSTECSTNTVDAVLPDVPLERYDALVNPRTGNNALSALSVSIDCMTGVFNPFFAYAQGDSLIADITQLYLTANDSDGNVCGGVDKACMLYDIDVSSTGQTTSVALILKNGITFPDGSEITTDDVLYSMYLLCDPEYDGPLSFSKLPICGLDTYRLQIDSKSLSSLYDEAERIYSAGLSTDDSGNFVYPSFADISAERVKSFWEALDTVGPAYSEAVINNHCTAFGSDIGSSAFPIYSAAEAETDISIRTAFTLVSKGYCSLLSSYTEDDNGKYGFVANPNGEYTKSGEQFANWSIENGKYIKGKGGYSLVKLIVAEDGTSLYRNGEQELTYTGKHFNAGYYAVLTDSEGYFYDISSDVVNPEFFWKILVAKYGFDFSLSGLESESSNTTLFSLLADAYALHFGTRVSVDAIPGIYVDSVICSDNVERSCIHVELTDFNTDYLYSFHIPIVERKVFNDGYEGNIGKNGVDFSDSDYMDFIRSKNSSQGSAGAYSLKSSGKTYALLTANESFLLGSPQILTIRLEVSGDPVSSLLTGETLLASVSASSELKKDLDAREGDYVKIQYTTGHGNTGFFLHFSETHFDAKLRKAIETALNLSSTSDVFDSSAVTAKQILLDAGYSFDSETQTMKYPPTSQHAGEPVSFQICLSEEPHGTSDNSLSVRDVLDNFVSTMKKAGINISVSTDKKYEHQFITPYRYNIVCWIAEEYAPESAKAFVSVPDSFSYLLGKPEYFYIYNFSLLDSDSISNFGDPLNQIWAISFLD